MSRGNREEPMKVVIINTEYVETDAVNFKSVVQRLTGKDSSAGGEVGPAGKPSSKGSEGIGSTRVVDHHHTSSSRASNSDHHHTSSSRASNSVFSRGVSFKDFDRLLKDLPPLDELYRLLC